MQVYLYVVIWVVPYLCHVGRVIGVGRVGYRVGTILKQVIHKTEARRARTEVAGPVISETTK